VNTLPPSLVRFESQLEEALRRDRARRPRRLVIRTSLAVASAAAVALGILNLLPGSGASVVERAAAALRGADGTVLHTVLVGRMTGADGTSTMRIESWQESTAPYDRREIVTENGRQAESATVNGVEQIYDPQANTIYTTPPQATSQKTHEELAAKAKAERAKLAAKAAAGKADKPAKPTPVETNGDPYRGKILDLLDSGKIHEAGRTTVGGREAIELVSDDGTVSLTVDAGSYDPIAWRVSQDGKTAIAQFPTYERLPADQAAPLLSLSAQHPDAAVDASPDDYQAAAQRLFHKQG